MIRFVFAIVTLIVAIIVAPFAFGNPALNSADGIVIVAPVVFVWLAIPPTARPPGARRH